LGCDFDPWYAFQILSRYCSRPASANSSILCSSFAHFKTLKTLTPIVLARCHALLAQVVARCHQLGLEDSFAFSSIGFATCPWDIGMERGETVGGHVGIRFVWGRRWEAGAYREPGESPFLGSGIQEDRRIKTGTTEAGCFVLARCPELDGAGLSSWLCCFGAARVGAGVGVGMGVDVGVGAEAVSDPPVFFTPCHRLLAHALTRCHQLGWAGSLL